MKKTVLALFFWGLILGFSTPQAGMLIYPAKGQTPEQQAKDEYECHQWAVQKTGYDPTKTQHVPEYKSNKRGGVVKGAAGGALLGVGIGAIAGNAGKGAAIGAGAGAVGGGLRQRRQNKRADEQNQQARQELERLIQEYNQAKALCLEGRGYKVQVK